MTRPISRRHAGRSSKCSRLWLEIIARKVASGNGRCLASPRTTAPAPSAARASRSNLTIEPAVEESEKLPPAHPRSRTNDPSVNCPKISCTESLNNTTLQPVAIGGSTGRFNFALTPAAQGTPPRPPALARPLPIPSGNTAQTPTLPHSALHLQSSPAFRTVFVRPVPKAAQAIPQPFVQAPSDVS